MLVTTNFAHSCSNFMFPKRIWAGCRGFDEKVRSACDYAFACAISRRHDFGFVDRVLVHYRVHGASLYRTADGEVRDQDLLRIHTSLDPRRLGPKGRVALRRVLSSEFCDLAHGLRQRGDYLGSLAAHLQSLHHGGCHWNPLAGIMKLLPHWVVTQFGRRAASVPRRARGIRAATCRRLWQVE
jgi:hypothetical protein